VLETLEEIGRRRGCLVSGDEVDRPRAAELVLRELRAGKLGRISLEHPADLTAGAESEDNDEP